MWKLAAIVLVACGGGTRTGTVTGSGGAAPGTLAKDTQRAARLVYERNGTAWDVHCDGKVLAKRPWEGGALVPIGACGLADPVNTMVIAGQLAEDVVALDRNTVARWNPELGGIMVVEGSGEPRTIPVAAGQTPIALAIDGRAIVAVAKPGTLIRIDGDKIAKQDLGIDPVFVATGPERIVIAAKTGAAIACDYQLHCDPVHAAPGAAETTGGIATQDGGLVLYGKNIAVTRIDAHGIPAWTTKLSVYGVYGATEHEVWVSQMIDRRPLAIRALSLASGEPIAIRATVRTEARDAQGRFLEIHAVAQTAKGPVVRGMFGGSLRDGDSETALDTERLRAVCYWETYHEGQEIPVPFDAKCDERFAKAIDTKHEPFVGANVEILRQ